MACKQCNASENYMGLGGCIVALSVSLSSYLRCMEPPLNPQLKGVLCPLQDTLKTILEDDKMENGSCYQSNSIEEDRCFSCKCNEVTPKIIDFMVQKALSKIVDSECKAFQWPPKTIPPNPCTDFSKTCPCSQLDNARAKSWANGSGVGLGPSGSKTSKMGATSMYNRNQGQRLASHEEEYMEECGCPEMMEAQNSLDNYAGCITGGLNQRTNWMPPFGNQPKSYPATPSRSPSQPAGMSPTHSRRGTENNNPYNFAPPQYNGRSNSKNPCGPCCPGAPPSLPEQFEPTPSTCGCPIPKESRSSRKRNKSCSNDTCRNPKCKSKDDGR